MTFTAGPLSPQHQVNALVAYRKQRTNPLRLSEHRRLRSTASQPPTVELNEHVPVLGPLAMPGASEEFTKWLVGDRPSERQCKSQTVDQPESQQCSIVTRSSTKATVSKASASPLIPTTKDEIDPPQPKTMKDHRSDPPSPRWNATKNGKGDILRDFFLWITTRRDPTRSVQAILMEFGRTEIMSAYVRLDNRGWGIKDLQVASEQDLEQVTVGAGGKVSFSGIEGTWVGPMTAAKPLTPGLMQALRDGAQAYGDHVRRDGTGRGAGSRNN